MTFGGPVHHHSISLWGIMDFEWWEYFLLKLFVSLGFLNKNYVKCLNHDFECNWPMWKIVATYPKRVFHFKLYVLLLVFNPCIHDIYVTNFLYHTIKYFHPILVSMECDSMSHSNIHWLYENPLDLSSGLAWWKCWPSAIVCLMDWHGGTIGVLNCWYSALG